MIYISLITKQHNARTRTRLEGPNQTTRHVLLRLRYLSILKPTYIKNLEAFK